jgi:acetolactate synthase-1/2/3 large subunit
VPALKKALSAEGPVLIDCLIEEDDKVFPMVSPGRSLSECFDASDLKG